MIRALRPVALVLSALALTARAALGASALGASAPEKQVVVVVGLPGSGKSTWAREIAAAAGAPEPVAAGDVVRSELRARGLPYTPENEASVAADFARRPGAIADAVAARLGATPGEVAVVEGLRSPVELGRLRRDPRFAVTVVALEAPHAVRHARMLERDRRRYAAIDQIAHREHLRRRDAVELERGVGALVRGGDLRLDTSGSPESTRAAARALGARFAGAPAALTPLFAAASRAIPHREIGVMARNPWVAPYLGDVMRSLADMAGMRGARGLVARLARARSDADARGASYEAWTARSFSGSARAVAVIHDGNEADLVLHDGTVVEAKAGRPGWNAIRQLRARARGGRPVRLVSGRTPDAELLGWFARRGAVELPGGFEVVHLPMGGAPRRLLGSPPRRPVAQFRVTPPRFRGFAGWRGRCSGRSQRGGTR